MACVDSSDEEDRAACEVGSTTAILEDNVKSPVHVAVSPVSVAAATSDEKPAEVGSKARKADSPLSTVTESDNADQPGFRSKSSSTSQVRPPQACRAKANFISRERVMSDCSNMRRRRISIAEDKEDENGRKDGRVSFNNSESPFSLANRFSKVQFKLGKSISLGVDNLAAKTTGIKRNPTGRKHKQKSLTSTDSNMIAEEEQVQFRKSCERKGTFRRKPPSPKTCQGGGGVQRAHSATEVVTYRATVQRKGTTRGSGPRRRGTNSSSGTDTASVNSCGELPVSFKSPPPRLGRLGPLVKKLSLARMFNSEHQAENVVKSQSNPVACLHATPGNKRRDLSAELSTQSGGLGQPASSSISNLMRRFKIAAV